VVRGEQRLGRKVVEKVARQLANAFPVERIAAQTHETLAHMPTWAELRSRGRAARGHAEAFLAEIHLPHMPSLEEIRAFAEQRLARTVSLDEIARRTRQILLEAVAVRLLSEAETARAT
jgi:stearoyl-CoA desaturase (delta-9 desaturase)